MRSRQYLSYRRWRWMSLLIAGALVLGACAGGAEDTTTTAGETGGGDTTTTAAQEPETTTTTTAATVEPVTLQIQASNAEYLNGEIQIWDIFQAQNPGVTIDVFAVNEDDQVAYRARRAGGYFPAIEALAMPQVDIGTQDLYVDLLTVDTEWLDRWQYDVRTAESEFTGGTGLRSLNPLSGFWFTWVYNADLMDSLGLDPRSVKTQADLQKLLVDGQAAVDARDDIDFFWDVGYHGWVWSSNYLGLFPLPYKDGQRDPYQQASWSGEIEDPSEDPFRYTFQYFKDAYEAGLLPDSFWLRTWDDMEVSYIAGKSVMMLHGPWVWDKMLSENPDARQLGIPATPPLVEGDPWIQYVASAQLTSGYRIPVENLDLPEWPIILKAFNFWNSPEIVALRAGVNGSAMAYNFDEPLALEGPQYTGILQEFQPGGLYEDLIITSAAPGQDVIAQYKNEDSGNFWDWQWSDTFAGVVQGEMTIDEALEWFHNQVATDYTIP
ncbi:MAG: carbohydrate ABC transporter substrate-binding protein [Actinobacteria bacterium]|nr:carbohydrate ABC transporter substrate-binding protein [Actinomycetota bacterium]